MARDGAHNGPVTPEPDGALDDTAAVSPRPAPRPAGPDSDDTVPRTPASARRGSVAEPRVAEPRAAEPLAQAVAAEPLARAAAPADPPPAAAAEPPASPALVAELPNGHRVEADRPIYLGRRPSAPRYADPDTTRLVTLESPARQVSATHLELRAVGATLVASDLHSTNGTIVALPGVTPQLLVAGGSLVLTEGSVLDLGEGNVVRIRSRG